MKNKLFKLTIATAVFVCGAGLAISQNKQIAPVEAAARQENFDPYSYSGTYYNSLDTNGSDGVSGGFKTALGKYVLPKDWYDYSSGLKVQLQKADEDPTNSSNMIYFYTRDSVKKNAASTWNREHVWPQSLSNGHWGQDNGGCDMLHLRPTYNKTNSDRGNKLYADCNKQGAMIYSGVTYGYSNGGYFEPLDCVKGDVARIIMYTHVVYSEYYRDNNLKPTKTIKDYDTLLKWHMQDKPDELEGNRNNYCQTTDQKNRNPFVDHPEYAWRIYSDCASAGVIEQCKSVYPADGSGTQGKKLTGISISGEANKKEYYVGQSFDPTGLTINATYDDNSTGTIPPTNCTWTPERLTVGTTSVTCKYGNFTATYSGITVTERVVSGTEFSATFKANGSDTGDVYTSATAMAALEDNTLIESFDSFTKVFSGRLGFKFGSTSAEGNMTFTLKEEVRIKIVSIKVDTKTYTTGSGDPIASVLTIKFDDQVIESNGQTGSSFTKPLDEVSCTKVTISATGRVYLTGITIEIKGNDVPPTPGPGSSSSSSAPTSTPSSNLDSSEPISSTSQQPSSEQSGNKVGCNGSIIAVSAVTSISALAGLVLVLSKKKKEK